jgi:hypothetical protein
MKKYILAALVLATLASAGAVLASEKIWGRVEKVDTAANTITAWNGQMGTYTIKTDGATKITQDGKAIKLSEIKISSHLEGTADKQSDGTWLGRDLTVSANARRQDCSGIGGRIESVDKASRTLSMWSRNLGSYKVAVANDAKITSNGKEAKFEDLEAGDMAWFTATKNDDGTYTATKVDSKDDNGRGGCRGGCRGGGRGNGRGRGRN